MNVEGLRKSEWPEAFTSERVPPRLTIRDGTGEVWNSCKPAVSNSVEAMWRRAVCGMSVVELISAMMRVDPPKKRESHRVPAKLANTEGAIAARGSAIAAMTS